MDVAAALDSCGPNPNVSQDQSSPTCGDFVFVTETEVKDAVKTAQEPTQQQHFSPRRLRRGLREGTWCF